MAAPASPPPEARSGRTWATNPAPAASAAPAAPDGSGSEEYRKSDVTGNGPLIVRTGQLTLEIAVLDDALADAEAAVTAAGGYVAASQRQGDGESAGATVTYRIPAERWDATLAALRAVGTKVLSEQTASEEVTSQVVDLGARLVNLRATESALQAIMTRAAKIPDILEVQAQLTGVRQEIDKLTAQKLSLEKQAALATLTVGFSLPPTVAVTQVQEGWTPGTRWTGRRRRSSESTSPSRTPRSGSSSSSCRWRSSSGSRSDRVAGRPPAPAATTPPAPPAVVDAPAT